MKTLITFLFFVCTLAAQASENKIFYTYTPSDVAGDPGTLSCFYEPPLPDHYYVWIVRDLVTGEETLYETPFVFVGYMRLDLQANQRGQWVHVEDWGKVILNALPCAPCD